MMISFVSFYVSFVEFFILNFSVYMSIDFMHFFYLTSIILNFFTFTIWLADKGKMTMYHELTKYLIVRHFKWCDVFFILFIYLSCLNSFSFFNLIYFSIFLSISSWKKGTKISLYEITTNTYFYHIVSLTLYAYLTKYRRKDSHIKGAMLMCHV